MKTLVATTTAILLLGGCVSAECVEVQAFIGEVTGVPQFNAPGSVELISENTISFRVDDGSLVTVTHPDVTRSVSIGDAGLLTTTESYAVWYDRRGEGPAFEMIVGEGFFGEGSNFIENRTDLAACDTHQASEIEFAGQRAPVGQQVIISLENDFYSVFVRQAAVRNAEPGRGSSYIEALATRQSE